MDAVHEGHVAVDGTLLHQLEQALVHGAHALVAAGGDDGIHLVRLFLADEVADGGVGVHDLERGNQAAVLRRHQLLADDGLQNHRQLQADLALLLRRAISAAVTAVPMVSVSRISPSRMTSGASRMAERRASA